LLNILKHIEVSISLKLTATYADPLMLYYTAKSSIEQSE
jgi:hypothetical protein